MKTCFYIFLDTLVLLHLDFLFFIFLERECVYVRTHTHMHIWGGDGVAERGREP